MSFQPKAIITDLDGVIRHFPRSRDREIEARYGLAEGTLEWAAFEPNDLAQVITGKITDATWRNRILQRLNSNFPDPAAALAFAEWSDYCGRIDFEVLHYLQSIAQSLPLALLTNATDRLPADLSNAGIHKAFRHVFNSSSIGSSKPSKEIYHFAVRELGTEPDSILFIDDSETNVASAEEFGFKALHFSNIERLRKQVESALV